jgi:hypothetical protein
MEAMVRFVEVVVRRAWWGPLLVALALVPGCASGPEQVESPAAARARQLLRSREARRGSLLLRCEPVDAEVLLDGVPQGVCTDFGGESSGLRVGVGLHRIDVMKEGFWPYTTYFEPGQARAGLNVRLRQRGPGSGDEG